MSTFSATPLEQPCDVCAGRRTISIGLPANRDADERRFPLTPEAVAIIVDKGIRVKIQTGAALPIHYTDADYLKSGAEIVERDETLQCDIVAHLPALTADDIRYMRKGAMLMTLYHSYLGNAMALNALIERSVIAVALDCVVDNFGNHPFADILREIDGRAAMAVASGLQTDPIGGKGILMGGIAGVVPCEVTVLGSGIAACAAARSAIGLGATVRMFDNDVYRLRNAIQQLGDTVIGSAIQPHVLEGALHSADVVIATPMRHPFVINSDMVAVMKRKAIVIDVTEVPGNVFPSIPTVDLSRTKVKVLAGLQCLFNVCARVPRTVAMAMSNALITMADDIIAASTTDKIADLVRLLPGIQPAVFALLGKLVNAPMAASVGMRCTDISIYMTLS